MEENRIIKYWQEGENARHTMWQHQPFFKFFIDSLIKVFNPKKGAIVDSTNFRIVVATDKKIDRLSACIQFIKNGNLSQKVIQTTLEKVSSKLDNSNLIISFLPLGIRRKRYELKKEDNVYIPIEYQEIWDYLDSLCDNGILFVNTSQHILYTSNGKKFQEFLKQKGFVITAYFELPFSLYPYSGINLTLIAIEKTKRSEPIFIAEIGATSNFEKIIYNFINQIDSGSIFEGTYTDINTFTSITNYKITQQIDNLKTEYKYYKQYELKDVAFEINLTKNTFKEKDNTIYIPLVGNSPPVTQLNDMKLKPKNYFQVVLSENVKNRYLEIFFKSKMGSLALSSLIKGAVIGYRAKADLEVMKIPIPELKIQELIIATSNKIELLKNSVNSFEAGLSMNPNSANLMQNKLDDILVTLGKLSKEEEILTMIRSGESKILELKQTFTKDIDTNIKEKEKKIRTASLKNIVAFLNTDGGTLLIGVKDNGTITGIEVDYYENDDKYCLNFKNQIRERIGEDCYPFLDWEIIEIKNKKILRVDCKPANTPFFLDKKEFFVRTNPSADKLEGDKLLQYIKTRFPDK